MREGRSKPRRLSAGRRAAPGDAPVARKPRRPASLPGLQRIAGAFACYSRLKWTWHAALLALGFVAVPSPAQGGQERLTVLVTILPQATFVRKVAGELVEVEVLVKAGQDPHTYEVTPKQMARFAGARVFFKIGLPLEDRLLARRDLLPAGIEVVDTRAGVPLLAAGRHEAGQAEGTKGHGQGEGQDAAPPGGEGHAAPGQTGSPFRSATPAAGEGPAAGPERLGNADLHIWLDPRRVKIQAGTICETLVRAAPGHAEAFRANLERFRRELDELDQRIADRLGPHRGASVYVFHPALGYFCDRYGLRQAAVEAEGKEPGARELAGLIERARRDRVKTLFVEPQFTTADAATIAGAIGAELVVVDPLAADCLGELDRLAGLLARGLGEGSPPEANPGGK